MTRALRSAVLLALALALGGAAARAQSNAGTSGAQFLKIGAGARAGAMADAFTAVADDAYAAYYNPAGLARLRGPQLAGAHTSYFEDITYDVLTFAYPFGPQDGRNALSLSVYHLGVGDIERRVGDSTDAVGTFGAADDAYALSYARTLGSRLSLGLTGKYVSQTLDSYRASAFAADVGALYRTGSRPNRGVTLAATVRNLGQDTGYVDGHEDPMPTGVVVGAAYRHSPSMLFSFDAGKHRDTKIYGAGAFEYSHAFTPVLSGAFRTGFTSHRRDNGGLSGLSAGVGVTFNRATFDFAWQPFGGLGDTFRYSLLVKF